MKRWIALVLALVLLTLCCSCAADTVDVMQYGKSHITANMYRYWLSSYKGTFLYTYSDMTDSDAFWDSVLYDDVTAEEYLNEAVLDNVKRTLVCMELFREKGLRLPASAEDEIDAYIDDLIQENSEGESALEGGENAKLDPWDNEYKLEIKGKKVIVISAGPDGEFGNDDDIRSDKIKRQKKSND